jgi:hypothetical protein
MADDQQNPFTMMGMMQMMQPNKYEPAAYKNKPLSLQGFRGPATDARGNVIQSYADAQAAHDAWDQAHPAPTPGRTLNTPGQTFGLQPSDLAGPSALNPSGNLAVGMADWGGMMSPQARDLYRNSQFQNPGGGYTNPELVTTAAGLGQGGPSGAKMGQSGPAAVQQNPVDMRQAYLDALANPGHVTTPGADIPASKPIGSPSVMDAFLAQNKGGGGGAGGYSNEGFFNTLNKLRSA